MPRASTRSLLLERAGGRIEARLLALDKRLDAGDESAWPEYLALVSALVGIEPALSPERVGRLMTTAEMARRLGVSVKTLLRRRRRGELAPALELGHPLTFGRFRLVRAGAWESVLASLLIERDWATVERTAAELRGEIPQTGESTAPLTEEQTATLLEFVRRRRRTEYEDLCAALGVVNGAALWAGLERRLGLTCPHCGERASEAAPPGCPPHLV